MEGQGEGGGVVALVVGEGGNDGGKGRGLIS